MAVTQNIIVQPRPNVKQINYLSKTFAEFRQNLIEFARAYYPNTYSDFNESSPGMMFIEMASYLGDVMSFYIDNQFKENLLQYADQPENVVAIAQFLGYKPKLVGSATGEVELSIIVASSLDQTSTIFVPNQKLLPTVGKGTILSTDDGRVRFVLTEDVNFKNISAEDYIGSSFDQSGVPTEFLVTKRAKVQAGELKTTTFTFGSFQKFATAVLPDESIAGIVSVVDSDGNTWYEVDYLAQDAIIDDVDVTGLQTETGSTVTGMRMRKVPRRFVTRITRTGRLQLMFGSGETNDAETDILIDSRQIANAQYGNTITNTINNIALNNLNFLNSSAFGLSPSNTTLTVTYLVAGGVETNTPSNTITSIDNLIVNTDVSAYTPSERTLFTAALQRLRVTNPTPATGGGDAETIDEIRENALAHFNAQNRVVTAQDYVVRVHSLPPRYGSVAKAFAVRDEQLNSIMQFSGPRFVENKVRPTAVNLYVLGYDSNGKLSQLNNVIKDNLQRYLESYRMMTDEVTILDAFIVNIAVRFNIIVFRNYNMNDVLARCIDAVKKYFDITKWSINQPIILSDLTYVIGQVDGVQTVTNVSITNKYQYADGQEYQPYKYDIDSATVDGVVYPSLDPCIFEIKYPENDIIGTATQ